MNTQSHLTDSHHRSNPAESVGNRQRLIRVLAFLPLAFIVLCGAAPPPQGTSFTGGVGYADQEVAGGCSSKRVSTIPVYGSVEHRINNHFTLSSEFTHASALSSSVQTGAGLSPYSTTWATRVGYHGKSAGIALGPRLSYYAPEGGGNVMAYSPVLWSVQGWAGDPENVYGYVRSFAGPQTPNIASEFLNVGVGIRRDDFEVEVDWPALIMLEAPQTLLALAPELHASFRIDPHYWLGVEASSWNHSGAGLDSRLMLTLTFKSDELSRRKAKSGL